MQNTIFIFMEKLALLRYMTYIQSYEHIGFSIQGSGADILSFLKAWAGKSVTV